MMEPPEFIVIAGPNGAGKSTAAAHLLSEDTTFLNADEIAKSLPSYPSQGADIQAGRILLTEMARLEAQRSNIAVETTLASRSLAARAQKLRAVGYVFHLAFAFLPDPEMAVRRVAGRVLLGGHDIPVETIRRRYLAGLSNFFELYQPLADRWFVFDTTEPAPLKLIAHGRMGEANHIEDSVKWHMMRSLGNAH